MAQKYRLFHDLNCELKMDIRKRKQKTATQTWRAVSTQPNYLQGGVGKQESVARHEEGNSYFSSTALICKSETSNPKIGNELSDLVTCPSTEASNNDGKLMPTEKHLMSMEIGASLIRFIKGKGGLTQKEIEEETGVKIIFPSSKKEDSITIEGKSVERVTKAFDKIQSIIDKAVNGRDFDYSHFVSIPLATHPGLVEKLFNFQNKILGVAEPGKNENLGSNSGGYASNKEGQHSTKVANEIKTENTELGIERSIFIKPKTFHLTVLMLKLWNKDRIKAASEVLQSVSQKVKDALDDQPVFVRLKGLDCMRGSLSKAHVLYAPVEVIGGEDRILRACKIIIDAYVEAGLVIEKDVQQKLKLHATLMNARHRKRKKGSRKVDSFDARGIFELYGSEEWGEYPIREVHLSQRYMFDENGYYHCCMSIPFPDEIHVDRSSSS